MLVRPTGPRTLSNNAYVYGGRSAGTTTYGNNSLNQLINENGVAPALGRLPFSTRFRVAVVLQFSVRSGADRPLLAKLPALAGWHTELWATLLNALWARLRVMHSLR